MGGEKRQGEEMGLERRVERERSRGRAKRGVEGRKGGRRKKGGEGEGRMKEGKRREEKARRGNGGRRKFEERKGEMERHLKLFLHLWRYSLALHTGACPLSAAALGRHTPK